MNTNLNYIKLKDVLAPSEERIDLNPNNEYREITVRLWGKGITERQILSGLEISATKRKVVRTNQFILSRIDARHGASGIVPEELSGAVVSNDFLSFNIDESMLLPQFLGWMSKTKKFVEMCKKVSEGTTNRVRLNIEKFLEIKIPLPPLPEQRRMADIIEQVANRIEQGKHLKKLASKETDALVDAELRKLIIEATTKSMWEFGPTPKYAEINPSRKGAISLSSDDSVSFIPMSAVDDVNGVIREKQSKKFYQVSKGYTWFKDGDVIFAKITPCMQNGKSAIAKDLENGNGFGSTEFHVLRPGPKILAEWLLILVRSTDFRKEAEMYFKGTAGQQRVPQSFLEEKIIPVPPIEEQKSLVNHFNKIRTQISNLRVIQQETFVKLNALMPSILDKAFKGEL